MLKLKKHLTNVSLLSRQLTTTSRLASSELNTHRDTDENNSKTPFEFTAANMKRLEAAVRNYPVGYEGAAVNMALDLVQRQIGWIPISAMHKIANVLNMPRMRVYECATFYTMFNRRYRGKYHVNVCTCTPCMIRGGESILAAAEEACCCSAGSTSTDGMFGVDAVECAGACVNAPVMAVGDDYYEDLTECDVFNIIHQIRCGCIPQPGPQNGRFCSEPITGLTSLTTPPPPPGFGMQSIFTKK